MRWEEYQALSRASAIRRSRSVEIERCLAPGLRERPRERVASYRGVLRCYLANQGPRREEDWSVAKVFTQAVRWLERRPPVDDDAYEAEDR